MTNQALYQSVLDTPMGDNDAGADTIGKYFIELALAVWRENEGFSGKRPFGNSGWESEIYQALCMAGIMKHDKHTYNAGGDSEYTEYETEDAEEQRMDELILHTLEYSYLKAVEE